MRARVGRVLTRRRGGPRGRAVRAPQGVLVWRHRAHTGALRSDFREGGPGSVQPEQFGDDDQVGVGGQSELRVAAEEQRRITHLRIDRLLGRE